MAQTNLAPLFCCIFCTIEYRATLGTIYYIWYMAVITKPLQFVYSIYCYLLFWLMGMVTALYFVLVLTFIGAKKKGDYLYSWCWWYSTIFGWLTGIRYEVTGRENLQKQDACVMTCNHAAVADMFILVHAIKGIRYRPLSKIELASIPLFGFLWRHTLVFVDRKSPESRKKSVQVVEQMIREQKISLLIFPEGTRNRTPQPLKDFYDGAFRIAIECQVSIVPMIILNTRRITPPKSWMLKPGLLICHFLPPISTAGMNDDDIEPLKEKVYALMEAAVVKHWREHGVDEGSVMP